MLSKPEEAKRFLSTPPTQSELYELYGAIAYHYRKDPAVKSHINPNSLLIAAKNNWQVAKQVLTTTLFLTFPSATRSQNLIDIYKSHTTNTKLKNLVEHQSIDVRATLPFLIKKGSARQQTTIQEDIDANQILKELLQIQLQHAASEDAEQLPTPKVRFAEQLEFEASSGYGTADPEGIPSAPKVLKGSLKKRELTLTPTPEPTSEPITASPTQKLPDETQLKFLKDCVSNAANDYVDYSNSLCCSFFHHHGNLGKARAEAFNLRFSTINNYAEAKEQLICYLSDKKNGNTHPHSFRTMLLQELQASPKPSLRDTSKQFWEQFTNLSAALNVNLASHSGFRA